MPKDIVDEDNDDHFDNDPFESKPTKKFDTVRAAIEDARNEHRKIDTEKEVDVDAEEAAARVEKVREEKNRDRKEIIPGKKKVVVKKEQENDNDEEDAGYDQTDNETKDDTELSDESNGDKKQDKKTPTKVRSNLTAPVGWTKEAKAEWNALPETVKSSIAKREEEASRGFKEYGDKTKRLKSYDDVVSKYIPDYQQFGISEPHQAVERTLEWFNALRHSDRNYAINALRQLARNFNLEDMLTRAYSNSADNNSSTRAEDNTQNNNSPENAAIAQLQHQIQELRNKTITDDMQRAQSKVDAWKRDKPHFDKVRKSMHALLSNGSIPTRDDGELDLDEAYHRAVRSDPELYDQIRQEELDKQREELEQVRSVRKDDTRKRTEAERARKANVSIKPTAPINSAPVNNDGRKVMSVRESIDLARREISGSN